MGSKQVSTHLVFVSSFDFVGLIIGGTQYQWSVYFARLELVRDRMHTDLQLQFTVVFVGIRK